MSEPVTCPACGSPMVLRETDKFKYKDGSPRKFYGCCRWPACTETHGAHPDGRPLGIPGDEETRRLRHECHEKIESLKMDMEVKDIYAALEEGMGKTNIHFGELEKGDCVEALRILNNLTEVEL